MKTKILTLGLILTALVAPSLRAQTDLASVEKKLELAVYSYDPALVAEAETAITAALSAEPKAPAWLYLQGMLSYAKAGAGYKAKDMKVVQKQLELAEKQLQAVKGQPWEAEAQALRGLLCGQLIGVKGGGSSMSLGPKLVQLTGDAYDSLPESPRVKMFKGMMYLNTPGMFGGDKPEAVKLLNSTVQQYDRAKPVAGALQWGHAMAWAWLAQARQQTGDLAGAREAVDAALKIAPDYRWVRDGILKSIEKAEAKKG